MSGYTKLFGSILESTVWLEPPPIKVVWITLLAMADRDGIVEASVPGLAKRAGVERGDCERALAVFLSPDTDSRTKDYEGRRIEVVPGGWRLLNYETYRERASAEESKEKAAARQRRKRERDKSRTSQNITPVTQSHDIAEADPSSKAPSEAKSGKSAPASTPYRRDPLIGKNPHLRHVFCDPTFSYCVPPAVHAKLTSLIAPKHGGDHDSADQALRAWYQTVTAKLVPGFVMGDEFKFWQGRFDAECATPEEKPTRRLIAEDADTQLASVREILKKQGVV